MEIYLRPPSANLPGVTPRTVFPAALLLAAWLTLIPASAAATEPDLVRVFRFHAAAEAEALRDAARSAEGLSEPLRADLLGRVRRHLDRVEKEAAGLVAAPPAGNQPARGPGVDRVVERGEALAREFNEGEIARWLDDNPSAFEPVQEGITLAEAYQRAAAEEPQAVVLAARAAGLPAPREPELRQAVDDVHRKLRREHEAVMRRLGEAEAAAARAAGIPPPPADEPEDPREREREGEREADRERPDPFLEKLPPAEREKLQLLSMLTEAELHARGVTAGRDARAAVERLLPQRRQRETLKHELLRWYAGQSAPDDTPAGDAGGEKERLPVVPRGR
jgi:hypothetical protein